MSRFFTGRLSSLTPYVPGEQPQTGAYIKLNTNESPFPPSPQALREAGRQLRSLQLYPDPDCTALRAAMARALHISPEEITAGNGSDELLSFAFLAFCDEECPAVFPQLTYGFYPVFAGIHRVPWRELPLRADFSIDPEEYYDAGGTVFLANPNAPTGLALSRAQIEAIVRHNPRHPVVIDEAYVDFGAESAVPLIGQYENLLVVQTFSKARSLAGGRLGFAMGSPPLIRDLNTLRCCTNPYNVSSAAQALGLGLLADQARTEANCAAIERTRQTTIARLRAMGFSVTDSMANFVFAAAPRLGGRALYRALREKGVLVRHFPKPPIERYIRITVGTDGQMDRFFETLEEIGKEAGPL